MSNIINFKPAQLMKLITLILIILFSGSFSLAQNQWEFSVNENGLRKVRMVRSSKLLGTSCTSRLQFICPKNNNGKYITEDLSMQLTVSPVSKLQGFDFVYFEGPDAPATGKNLIRITLTEGETRTIIEGSPAGWFSAEVGDGFTFGIVSSKNKNGPVCQVLKRILAGAESVEISIFDGFDPTKILSINFPVVSDRRHFQTFMKDVR